MDDWVGEEARDPAQSKQSDQGVKAAGNEGNLEAESKIACLVQPKNKLKNEAT